MKREELKNCCICDKGMMHQNSPVFYKIKLDHLAVNLRAIQQIHGMETFFGGGNQGAALANVMGTNPDIAEVITSSEVLICLNCMLDPNTRLAQIIREENDNDGD